MDDEASRGERLQRFLARAGVASRRHAEELISAGRVKVDGRVARLGDVLTGGERVLLDGRPVEVTAAPVTFMLYKPPGVLTTASDERGRRTVL
ncbi:MAG TPA: S4 domain-containing protein, partial [Deinococcales bacterium]|nr:S4 domain-containing protein [Deinococcales bacterium]